MACTSKYSYATEQLAKIPAHPIHFKEHMACPVITPDTGVSLDASAKEEKYRVRITVGGDKLDFVVMPHQWQPL